MIQVEVQKISFYPPSKGYAVLLKEMMGDRYLPVIVGSFEAQAIALALEEVQMPRPMTHDLFCSLLDELTVEINEIVISDLTEGTFFSKISLVSQLGTRDIDARPSDAIAIALRVGAPIFVLDTVMEEASIREIVEQPVSASIVEDIHKEGVLPPDEHIKKLEILLDKAVVDEEYEKAAEIRDKIKKIQTETNQN